MQTFKYSAPSSAEVEEPMTSLRCAVAALSVFVLAALPAAPVHAQPTGRVELISGTMVVTAATDRAAKFEIASMSALYPDGRTEHYVSLETGRKDEAYVIVAPCRDAGHDGPHEILCPAELTLDVEINLTARSDKLEMPYVLNQPLIVNGGLGNDKIDALGATTCTINGGEGNDKLGGCQGNTTLNGDAGNDKLEMPWTAGRGFSRLLNGGAGFDRIYGNVDVDSVDCGADGDRARVDPRDTTVNCEFVQIRENRD
jgi:hypothetical protein